MKRVYTIVWTIGGKLCGVKTFDSFRFAKKLYLEQGRELFKGMSIEADRELVMYEGILNCDILQSARRLSFLDCLYVKKERRQVE